MQENRRKNTVIHRCRLTFIAVLITLTTACSNEQSQQVHEPQNSQVNPVNQHNSNASNVNPSIDSAVPAQAHTMHWSYEGETGPEYWGALEDDYSTCKRGQQQSPINIEHNKLTTVNDLQPLKLNYHASKAHIVNNGHTIQLNIDDDNNEMILEDTKYTLTQFHFHHPSEHQIDGKHTEMELHLVHKSETGQTAVLGVPIISEQENDAFESIWNQLPQQETKEPISLEQPINIPSLLPTDLHSIRYTGSLTTPPCSENVSWVVLDHPIEMSQAQIAKFAEIFPDNHRPIQPLLDRSVQSEQVE